MLPPWRRSTDEAKRTELRALWPWIEHQSQGVRMAIMSMRAGSGTQSRSRGSGHMPCTDTAPPRYTCGPEVGDKLKSGAGTSTLRLTLRSTERQYTIEAYPSRLPDRVRYRVRSFSSIFCRFTDSDPIHIHSPSVASEQEQTRRKARSGDRREPTSGPVRERRTGRMRWSSTHCLHQ